MGTKVSFILLSNPGCCRFGGFTFDLGSILENEKNHHHRFVSICTSSVWDSRFVVRSLSALFRNIINKVNLAFREFSDRPVVTAWCDIVYLLPNLYWEQQFVSTTRSVKSLGGARQRDRD